MMWESSGIEEVCKECFLEDRLTSGGIGVSPPCGHAARHDTVKIKYRVVDVTPKTDVGADRREKGMRKMLESSGIVAVCRACFAEGHLTSGGTEVSPPCWHASRHDTVKIKYRVVDVTLKADWAPGDPV